MDSSFRGKILFSGASGLIGSALVRRAEAKQFQVIRLTRGKSSNSSFVTWNPESADPVSPSDRPRLEGATAAIHLSGANLSSHRWTTSYKQEIVTSRTQSTSALVRLFGQLEEKPRVLLCASATGIYGDRGDTVLSEDSAPGHGFLPDTCTAWEAEAQRAAGLGIRTVNTRFGVVLAREGGAFPKLLNLFRLGLGGKLGSGSQWFSWIALEDLVSAMSFLMQTPSVSGPVNFVSPQPVRNEEFTRVLAETLHRPAIFKAPAFALRLGLGQMADDALLSSTRTIPNALQNAGFQFRFPRLEDAFKAIL